MIYTITGNKRLKYSTPLIEYIKNNNLYDGETLIYTSKYTNGTFSITNPTSEYKNCVFVNGYPHFDIPLEFNIEEIKNFINYKNMYDYNFNIRYGDTHPHKSVPKLAQTRNLLIEESLSSLIGKNFKSYYALGDISIKSLNDFVKKYNIDILPEDLFKRIVNNNLDNDLTNKLLNYDKKALEMIIPFLKQMNLSPKEFIIESSLYTNQELYQKFKNDERYKSELKDNGELKYTLQELMFIYSILKNNSDVLINIIGSNQTDHVLKVNDILKENNETMDVRFLTYGICRNADIRDIAEWSSYFQKFIDDNNLNINNRKLTPYELLKIITTIVSNDNILDFANLNKYLENIKLFCNNITFDDKSESKDIINVNNDLICKMALVGYNLNKTIELGNQNHFYKYLLGIIKEYELNKEKYRNIENIYFQFINSSFSRLGFNDILNEENRKKVLKK